MGCSGGVKGWDGVRVVDCGVGGEGVGSGVKSEMVWAWGGLGAVGGWYDGFWVEKTGLDGIWGRGRKVMGWQGWDVESYSWPSVRRAFC